jgi:DNA-binding GntR family transcriptional regulator
MLEAIAPSPTREELVYARLRQAIIDGTLEPGQELVVTTVAVQLGVSRIPVMHACQRLVGEGFLVANPRRSITVAPLTAERIVEGNEVLLALECLALEHAAQYTTAADLAHWTELNAAVRTFQRPPGTLELNVADYRFHTALWEAARKPYLAQQIRLVFDHNEPARALGRLLHNAARSAAEHEQILDALRHKDVAAAQEALRQHRNHGTERALNALRQKQQREHGAHGAHGAHQGEEAGHR